MLALAAHSLAQATIEGRVELAKARVAPVVNKRYEVITKGGVVTYLSHTLQIPPEQIATLGDMPNDVLMFEKSGMSIAMGNASAEVQAQANFVTASNAEEGFATAIDRFILKT